jgi:predicted ATPase
MSHEALTLAQELVHPYSFGTALAFAAWLHHLRREGHLTQERAEAAIALGIEQELAVFPAMGTIFRGWALAQRYAEPATRHGQREEGMAQMRQGLMAWRATGAAVFQPYGLALLAAASAQMGQIEAGLTLLAEALAMINDRGERRWEAELYRLKGELLLHAACGVRKVAKPPTADAVAEKAALPAEECFQQSLDIARRQQAKSWELRAATSLSRLWHHQGKRDAARQLLAPTYGWFTEGFDTADLQEARVLLEELSQ